MSRRDSNLFIDEILDKAFHEVFLSKREILYLLGLKQADETKKLFTAARSLRHRYFGDSIFLYGFLYLSTWCRNDCAFCRYRVSNRYCRRYRKTDQQVIETAIDMAASGVHLLDLTMGEDGLYYDNKYGFEPLIHLVKEVKRQTSLPVMISFGALPAQVLENLFEAGAQWYACYQETHNEKLFHQLRLNQNYGDRLSSKYKAAELGLLIEEGILSGVGESLDDIVDSMEEMQKMGAHQLRVMNFIPQQGTAMQDFPPPAKLRELVIIAVLRLLFPHRLIPASLDVYGIDGLKGKLEAGANVVTSLILPQSEMVGVAQSTLDISEGYRTVKRVVSVLNELGLIRAELDDYISWVENERKKVLI